jgi:hypothetical protein
MPVVYRAETAARKRLSTGETVVHRLASAPRRACGTDATVAGMSTPRTPAQRLHFVESAHDHDVPAALAHRLLELSEAARAFAADRGSLTEASRSRLLAELRDDVVCEHARLVAAEEGEQLWRELLGGASPPDDVGPALLLAVSLEARCAADEARDVIDAVLRPGDYRRWALELGVDLAQDGGRPERAWELLGRLGVDRRIARYSTLRCVVFCTVEDGCAVARRPGIVRARWLWQRARDWVRCPWSELYPSQDERQLLLAEGGPLAELVREHRSLPGIGPMSQGLFGYLRRRWRLLPTGERDLVLRWLRTPWRRYSVVETRERELVLADAYGQSHVAGTEDVRADGTWSPGDMVSGWLLPTPVPEERLFVLNTAPAAWSSHAVSDL